jgi:hypothetical protein
LSLTDWIETGAKVLSVASVAAGMVYALNEFVVKDRTARLEKTKYTVEMITKGNETIQESRARIQKLENSVQQKYATSEGPIKDSAFLADVAHEYRLATKEMAIFYLILEDCVSNSFCDQHLSLALLCGDAEAYWEILQKNILEPVGLEKIPNRYIAADPPALGLGQFATRCRSFSAAQPSNSR